MEQKVVLTINKSLETEQYGEPTIEYRLSTEQENLFTVRVKERLPGWLGPADLQFGRDELDDWTIVDGAAVFTCHLESGEVVETLCSVQTEKPLDAFVSCPVVEVAPVERDGDESVADWMSVPRERIDYHGIRSEARPNTEAVVTTDGGEVTAPSERPPKTEHEPSDSEQSVSDSASSVSIESAIPPAKELDDTGEETRQSGEQMEDANGEDDPERGQEQTEASVVDEFIAALQSGDVSEEKQQTLREVLGVDPPGSMNARIEDCQTRLSDLSAYISALEEFLDEEGTGQQLLEQLQSDLAAVEEQVTSLESEVTAATQEQEELRERLDEIEDELSAVESVKTDVGSLRESVDDLESWQTEVTSAFAGTDPTGEM